MAAAHINTLLSSLHTLQSTLDAESSAWAHRVKAASKSYLAALIAFYRARVEIVTAMLKSHAWMQTVFRGRYKTLVAFNEINVVLAAFKLEIRRNLEHGKCMFEVYMRPMVS